MQQSRGKRRVFQKQRTETLKHVGFLKIKALKAQEIELFKEGTESTEKRGILKVDALKALQNVEVFKVNSPKSKEIWSF